MSIDSPRAAAPTTFVTAGLGPRFLGRLMSNVVPVVLAYAAVLLYVLASGGLMTGAAFVLLLLIGLGWSISQWERLGATGANHGRRVAGVAVVDHVSGQPIGFGRVALREVAPGLLSAITCGLFGLVDAIVALADSERRSLHDRLAKTRVVTLGSIAGSGPLGPSGTAVDQHQLRPVDPPRPPGPDISIAQGTQSPRSTPPHVGPSSGWSPPSEVISVAPGLLPFTPPEAPSLSDAAEATAVRPTLGSLQNQSTSPRAGFVLTVDHGQQIDVRGTVILGRNPAAGQADEKCTVIKIHDPSMSLSKTHAAVGLDSQGRLWVEDRGSTNGVAFLADGHEQTINSHERTVVPPDASLRLGDRQIKIQSL